ncbi:MAG: hypothetical protein HFF12_08635 [Angelakisella sp.]|nr:hypothetical protein [Angelakisella sp.]
MNICRFLADAPNIPYFFQKLPVLFGDLFLGLPCKRKPTVLLIFVCFILLKNQVSILPEVKGAALEKLGIFCGRPVVVFISCHGSFLLFLVGQELTIPQRQELNFFQTRGKEIISLIKTPQNGEKSNTPMGEILG